MTDPRKDDKLDQDLEALSRAYRAAPLEDGPPAALDDAIRAAARRAVHARPQPAPKTWFSRSSTPLAAAAVLVLTVSIGFLALHDPAVQVRPKGEDGAALNRDQAVVVPAAPAEAPGASYEPAKKAPAPASTAQSASPSAKEATPAEARLEPPPRLEARTAMRERQTAEGARGESFQRAEPPQRDRRPPVLAESVKAGAAASGPAASAAAPASPPPPPAPAATSPPAASPATARPEAVQAAPLDTVATTGSRVKREQVNAQSDAADRVAMQRAPAVAESKREAAQASGAAGDLRQDKAKQPAELAKKLDFAADPPAPGASVAGTVAPRPAEALVPAPRVAPAPQAAATRRSEEPPAKSAEPAPLPAPSVAAAPRRDAAPAKAVVEAAKPAADRTTASPGSGSKLGVSATDGTERALSADEWIKRILDLRKQGKLKEAEEALAQFRKRYPDYVLPEALREPKE